MLVNLKMIPSDIFILFIYIYPVLFCFDSFTFYLDEPVNKTTFSCSEENGPSRSALYADVRFPTLTLTQPLLITERRDPDLHLIQALKRMSSKFICFHFLNPLSVISQLIALNAIVRPKKKHRDVIHCHPWCTDDV